MYLLGRFELAGMLIRGECWLMAQFEVYFHTIFPSVNSRNLHLMRKNNAIVANSWRRPPLNFGERGSTPP